MDNNNDLELDFSEVDWTDTWSKWGHDSWLEFDYSGVDGGEEPWEAKEWESKQEESVEDKNWEAEDDASKSNPEEAGESSSVEDKEWESKEDSETPADEKKESPQEEESEEDDTLKEIDALLSELDDKTDESWSNIDKANELVSELWSDWAAWEASQLLEEIKLENAQYKTTVEQMNNLLKKLNKEKWEVMMRNTELELYGNTEDPSLMYLNWHIDKAKAGDEKSKRRIISILDDMRTELAWSTLEEDNVNNKADLISKVSSIHSSANPNTSIEWGLDSYEINL